MSTTAGQGAKNRGTRLQAIYGTFAESKDVRKHLAIEEQHRKAVDTLAVYEQFAAKKRPGFDKSRVEAQRQKLSRLERLLLASFQKVRGQFKTLESLAAIAKRSEAPGGFKPIYPVEVLLWDFYKADQKSRPILKAIARFKKPGFTDSDMNEWEKQYGITDLKSGKAGRKAKHPTHAEQVETLTIKSLDKVMGNGAERELRRVKEKAIDERDRKGKAKLEALEKSWPERVAQIERDFKKHRAKKAGHSKR